MFCGSELVGHYFHFEKACTSLIHKWHKRECEMQVRQYLNNFSSKFLKLPKNLALRANFFWGGIPPHKNMYCWGGTNAFMGGDNPIFQVMGDHPPPVPPHR